MDFVSSFESDYQVEEVLASSSRDSELRRFYFPGASTVGGRDGVMMRVIPASTEPWIGCFASGLLQKSTLTRVFSCPNPNEICVVSSGAGYFVRTDDPLQWQTIRSIPVVDVRAVTAKAMLIFADFTKLVSYGGEGLRWESARLSSDGIQIVDVTSERLNLIVWDAARQQNIRAVVDVDNGLVLSRHPIHE